MSNQAAPGTLDLKPLEIRDFSGGMTDFFLQGAPNRYERADNFLIDVDKMLEQRPGSVGFDNLGNHKLPGPAGRVSAFLLFKNETELLVNRGRDIFYRSPNWTRLLGPTGNEAIGAGNTYSSLSWIEWKDHVFMTNDAGPIPSKFYKGEDGTYQVRTVGLPLPKSVPTYTNSALLIACLALANDLRASMVGHIKDQANTSPGSLPVAGYLHAQTDKWSLSYFEAQTWFFFDTEYPGPQPPPTPAPAATDEASLYNLVFALCQAYEHHGADAETGFYHFGVLLEASGGGGTVPPKGPYQRLANNTKPSDLQTAAQQLNELRTKWYWHRWGIYTHSLKGDLALNTRWNVTAPAITTSDILGNIDTTGVPSFTANYADLFRYVNYLKNVYNLHVTNAAVGADWNTFTFPSDYHSQKMNDDLFHTCTIPDATDLDSAFLLIYAIWAMYGAIHVFDSNWPVHRNVTLDETLNSPNVADVKLQATGAAHTIPVDSWLWKGGVQAYNDGDINNRMLARVLSSASGTATLSKQVSGAGGDQPYQYSNSWYHVSSNGFSWPSNIVTATDKTNLRAGADEFLDPSPHSGLITDITLPPTTEAWIALADQVWFAIATHIGNGATHSQTEAISNMLQGNGPFFTPQISNYAYAVVYEYTYKTDTGVEFQNRSAPIFIGPIETSSIFPLFTQMPTPEGVDGPEANAVTTVSSVQVSNLPVLVNDATTNYDVSNINVEIYRTLDGGNTYYLLGEVDNGVTTYTDSTSDTKDAPGNDRLDTRQQLYTTGGVVANDQPPRSRFLHILNNTAYYGYVEDGGQLLKTRVIQSIPGAPDTAPPTFFDDIDDEITGISSARNNLIVFGLTSVYRMQGGYNNLGQGALTHEKISDTNGCVSVNSIVQTEIGVFYAGNDGFYYTDGFQLIKISIDLDLSYAKRTQTPEQCRKIYGTYDRINRRIWWTMQTEPTSEDCDSAFIFYLNYGVKPSGAFTTASGGNNWMPSALTFFQRKMIRGDARGLIFKHDEIYHSDPEVPSDLTLPLAQWNTAHVPYDYKSCALDFGSIYQGQWVTKVHMLGENAGNAALQFWSIADNVNDDRGKRPIAPIYHQDNLLWGKPDVLWGDPDVIWRYDGKLDYWRRFTAKTLRSQLKQVQIVPAYVGVYRSEDYADAQVEVDAINKVATLVNPLGFSNITWPLDIVGMNLALSFDNYEVEFPILSVQGSQLRFADPDNVFNLVPTPPAAVVTDTFPNGSSTSDNGVTRNLANATIVGNELDMLWSGVVMSRLCYYGTVGTGVFPALQPLFDVGELQFELTPGYSGIPSHMNDLDNAIVWLAAGLANVAPGGNECNMIRLIHGIDGILYFDVSDNFANIESSFDYTWLPVADQTYRFKIQWNNVDGGFFRVLIDGIIVANIPLTTKLERDNDFDQFRFGTVPGYGGTTDFVLDNVNLYSQLVALPACNWVIRGYQKEAGLDLMSYVLHYATVGNRGRAYQGKGSRGENVNG